jgi:hypothetical protein
MEKMHQLPLEIPPRRSMVASGDENSVAGLMDEEDTHGMTGQEN